MLLLADQMVEILENLRDNQWDVLLVQYLELWEVFLLVAPIMTSKVGMKISSLKYIDW